MELKRKLVTLLKSRAGDLEKSNVKEGECYTLPNTNIYISKRTGIYKISVPPYGTRIEYYYDLFFEDSYYLLDEDYEDIIDKLKEYQLKQKLEKVNLLMK